MAGEATPEPVIDAYLGYATPDGCVLRGRVLDGHRFSSQIDTPSRWNAVRNMARNFFTDEMPGVRVTSGRAETITDEEGYFQLLVPAMAPGWQAAPLSLPDCDHDVEARIIMPSPDAELGNISDVDDTVMRIGAYWLPRNLWTCSWARGWSHCCTLTRQLDLGGKAQTRQSTTSPKKDGTDSVLARCLFEPSTERRRP